LWKTQINGQLEQNSEVVEAAAAALAAAAVHLNVKFHCSAIFIYQNM